jgi:hypothetical protein
MMARQPISKTNVPDMNGKIHEGFREKESAAITAVITPAKSNNAFRVLNNDGQTGE